MATEVRLTILVEINGEPLGGQPYIYRQLYNEYANPAIIQASDGASTPFHAISALSMPNLNFFFATNDQAVNYEINQSGTSNPLPMQANGVVLIMGANLSQGTPSNNITVNVPGATQANLNIIGAGS